MSIQRKLMECAKNVRDTYKSQKHNWRYQMNYWGKSMRGHMEAIRKDALPVSYEIKELAEKAEVLLETHCDGEDCSYQR